VDCEDAKEIKNKQKTPKFGISSETLLQTTQCDKRLWRKVWCSCKRSLW